MVYLPVPAKRTLILNILDILRRYSDEDHRLSQKDIVEILQTEYDMTVERKSIRRNILVHTNQPSVIEIVTLPLLRSSVISFWDKSTCPSLVYAHELEP